ncbi:MAG TPA: hypothetical protein VFR36_08045 [Sphingomicrobium sp.]|nr:hypothetical protein [Sphingomicrobium sp.]
MNRIIDPRTLNRARWFADLTTALVEADRLLSLLETQGIYPVEMVRLRQNVRAVRSELELLNQVVRIGKRVIEAPWPDVAAGR